MRYKVAGKMENGMYLNFSIDNLNQLESPELKRIIKETKQSKPSFVLLVDFEEKTITDITKTLL